jgi:arylsulfatase A-like enzyme
LIASAIAVVLSCSDGSREEVQIDLTRLGGGLLSEPERSPLVGADGGSLHLVQAPGLLDFFVRLPKQSQLLFGLTADASPNDFAVWIESETSRETLVPKKKGKSGWSASLARFDGQTVRLRLENFSDGPLDWTHPRIVGVEETLPPTLDPGARPPQQPINVLLYVLDSLRTDRLSAYGYQRPTSPFLAGLARQGILFLNAYAPGSHTVPSITSLFSSRLPSELGGRLSSDGPARQTLAELFQAAGYETAAFQANFGLLAAFGYARGFDEYHRLQKGKKGAPRTLDASELHAHVIKWLRSHGDEPFFLYVQAMDLHTPYDPPPPYRDMFPRAARPSADYEALLSPEELKLRLAFSEATDPARYDGSVAYADHELSQLLAELRELGVHERTAIVVTSDHGEPLWQRKEFRHGASLYEELVRVPLIMFLPWHPGGERFGEIVSLMDLAPTLLDLAGIPVPEQFIGHSLFQPRGSLTPPRALGARLEAASAVSWYVREGPWKLIIDSERSRLFHLPSDPLEERDVSAEHPVEAGYLASLARARPSNLRETHSPPLDAGLSPKDREEFEQALEALGYAE